VRAFFLLAAAIASVAGCGYEATPPVVAEQEPEAAPFTMTAFNVENSPTITFDVPDMVCQYSCVPKVMETLVAQPGVKDVKIELETKTATIAIDREKFDTDAAIAALVDVQFSATLAVAATPPNQ